MGRITAQSLGNAFGRVGPVAAQLGVSLEEVNSAIDVISIKGSNTAESLTQFRGVMTALLKPSVAMRGALDDLGFSSAEVAVQTLGLTGVLRALADRTGGSSTEMAKLFRNVRGLSGAASLTAGDLKGISDAIDEMNKTGRDFNNAKFLQATATDAEVVTANINKLKNAMTVELGQSLLKTGADFAEFIGGADNVVKTVEILGPAIIGLTGSVIALRVAFAAADSGALGLAGTFRVLAAASLAAGLTKSAVSELEKMRSANNLAPLNALAKSNAEGLDKYKAQLAEARDADNKSSQDRLKTALGFTQNMNKEYLKRQADLKAARKVIDQLSKPSNAPKQLADAQAKVQQLSNIPRNVRMTDAQASQLAAARDTATRLQNQLATQSRQLADAQATVRRLSAQNPLGGVQGVDQLGALLGKKISTPDELSRGLIEAEKHAEELRQKIDQALAVGPQAENLKNELNLIFDQIGKKADVRNSVTSFNAPALRSQFDNVVQLFKVVNSDGKVTEQELIVLLNLAKQFRDNVTSSGSIANNALQKTGFASSLELLEQGFLKMKELAKLPSANIGPIQQELQAFEGALSGFAARLSESVPTSAAIAANLERAAVAAQQAAAASGGGGGSVEEKARGGLIYRAGGGFTPRGTDTVPAMLTPGEFVVNAASTRDFYSQLVAINSGTQPVYREAGGPVNVTFGDISINEAQHGKNTARDFVNGVRRELRRNTSII